MRKVIFWMHLVTALLVGLVVALMAVTGAAVAFQPQILESVDCGAAPAPHATRLSADEWLRRVRAHEPRFEPSTLLRYSAPDCAVVVSSRDGAIQVDPYTGEVSESAGGRWRGLFRTLTDWHRWLGTSVENRAVGRAITGVSNAAFLFLALSGLSLWWPRVWTAQATRLSFRFVRGLGRKARDRNWHNVIGFWALPVIVVVTASGMVISYRWASNLVYVLVGEAPPPAPRPPQETPRAPAAAPPVSHEALIEAAVHAVPDWKSVTLRLPAGASASVTVKRRDARPRFAAIQLTIDATTGQVLRRESYDDQTRGRRVRSWLRYLHTGEALGWPGQLAVALASLGAVVLAWTGFSLAWTRLVRRSAGRQRASEPQSPPGQ